MNIFVEFEDPRFCDWAYAAMGGNTTNWSGLQNHQL
jgi:hypothetical protein